MLSKVILKTVYRIRKGKNYCIACHRTGRGDSCGRSKQYVFRRLISSFSFCWYGYQTIRPQPV
jgi:hypothetical protein